MFVSHLCYIREVRYEREAVLVPAADVRLEEDVYLALSVLHSSGRRQLTEITQHLLQFLLLLVPNPCGVHRTHQHTSVHFIQENDDQKKYSTCLFHD